MDLMDSMVPFLVRNRDTVSALLFWLQVPHRPVLTGSSGRCRGAALGGGWGSTTYILKLPPTKNLRAMMGGLGGYLGNVYGNRKINKV